MRSIFAAMNWWQIEPWHIGCKLKVAHVKIMVHLQLAEDFKVEDVVVMEGLDEDGVR